MAYDNAMTTGQIEVHSKTFSGISAFFSNLAKSMELAKSAKCRWDLVKKLRNKTDEELAELGIRREDIVRHVFVEIYL